MTEVTQPPQLQLQLEETDEDTDSPQQSHNNNGRYRPPRPSALPRKSILGNAVSVTAGNRRRSSARFLSMGGNQTTTSSAAALGKMYQHAIKMNAENRINASNSWNFNLIENIDKFLTEEEPRESNTTTAAATDTNNDKDATSNHHHGRRRVNFTKASCTLDASVKIYSYRVDDVHLTSFRVLENLHRGDGGGGTKPKTAAANKQEENDDDPDARTNTTTTTTQRSKAAVSTIESNLANINLNKLDSAFDIDPLFHKMSKTFDEGGAKGLLLVNLGTSGNGCDIVFDSGLAEEEKEEKDQLAKPTTCVDISSLSAKLEHLLSGQTVYSLPLVPQLTSLRAEYSQLEEEGFVDRSNVPISRNRRFAPDPDEEKEADRSIHMDVMERSRASMARSFVDDDDDGGGSGGMVDNGPAFAADDYGGFDDDDDDGFDAFLQADDTGPRFSSLSFGGGTTAIESAGATATAALLDAISSGQVLAESEYEFLDTQELSHVAANAWAGSVHWKPLAHLHKPKTAPATTKPTTAKKPRSKPSKERAFVDLMQQPDVSDILRQPPSKSKSRRANDPLQLSATSITKYTKNEHLLPPDVGLRPNVLSSLFLRPNAFVQPSKTATSKTVGFAMDQVETYGGNDWDNGDDDDDGPGFAMSSPMGGDEEDTDDFIVEELDGVRKVDKVSVSYATIAKKVDVKRLKRDLWTELEAYFEAHEEKEEDDFMATPQKLDPSEPLSFQKTVQAMEAAKTQVDVTLPFYFICILHLANEKGLRLDSKGLEDFEIHHGDGSGGSLF